MQFSAVRSVERKDCLLLVSRGDLIGWMRDRQAGVLALGAALREAEEGAVRRVIVTLVTRASPGQPPAGGVAALRQLVAAAMPQPMRCRSVCVVAVGGVGAAIAHLRPGRCNAPLPVLVPREMSRGPSLAALQDAWQGQDVSLVSARPAASGMARINWLVRRAGQVVVRDIAEEPGDAVPADATLAPSGRYLLASGLLSRCDRQSSPGAAQTLAALLNAAIADGARVVACARRDTAPLSLCLPALRRAPSRSPALIEL